MRDSFGKRNLPLDSQENHDSSRNKYSHILHNLAQGDLCQVPQ